MGTSARAPSRRGRGPKGFATFKPNRGSIPTKAAILELYDDMRKADALPLGPRQVGYRLKERHPGVYDKSDFRAISEIVKRLAQAQEIPFAWVADASSVTVRPGGWESLADFVEAVPSMHQRDRRAGQPTVIEIYTEAKETLGLIQRVAGERGVTVYSGSGSSGPKLAHRVALRAVARAVDHDQSTLILGVCDFDQAGIRNITRPHVEHLAAFLYGTSGNAHLVACAPQGNGDQPVSIVDVDPDVCFEHLALTPRLALPLVDTIADQSAISAYDVSGDDLWNRDLDLLDGVQKVELEALDPPDLRALVANALDASLDGVTLKRIGVEEEAERGWLRERFDGFRTTPAIPPDADDEEAS